MYEMHSFNPATSPIVLSRAQEMLRCHPREERCREASVLSDTNTNARGLKTVLALNFLRRRDYRAEQLSSLSEVDINLVDIFDVELGAKTCPRRIRVAAAKSCFRGCRVDPKYGDVSKHHSFFLPLRYANLIR